MSVGSVQGQYRPRVAKHVRDNAQRGALAALTGTLPPATRAAARARREAPARPSKALWAVFALGWGGLSPRTHADQTDARSARLIVADETTMLTQTTL